MTEEKKAMYEAKKNFVENLLRPALLDADPRLTNVRYAYMTHPVHEEWVSESVTLFRGEEALDINVTFDSKLAILKDIVKQGGLE